MIDLTDMNLLYEAFLASMKGSSWKLEPQKFEYDFLSELTALSDELSTRTYRTSPSTEFVLCERGKVRYIHGGRMRDRVIRHVLCDNVLTPMLQKYLIYNNSASQKGKGISFAREQFERDLHNYWLKHHSNDGYVVIVDLKKFYDNIRHEDVKKAVDSKIDRFSVWLFDRIIDEFAVDVSYMPDAEFATCMDEIFNSIIYNEIYPKEQRTGEKFMSKSLEIGDQVSQNIGIFFPTWIDNYCKIVRGLKWYGRYMDDIYFLCSTTEEAHDIINGITARTNEIGLFVNEKKTQIIKMSSTFTYLQTKYFLAETGKVVKRINQKTITRERRKLKAYKRLLNNGEMLYEDIENAYKSWMGNFAKIMSKKQIKNMKRLYKELFGKEPRWKKTTKKQPSQG